MNVTAHPELFPPHRHTYHLHPCVYHCLLYLHIPSLSMRTSSPFCAHLHSSAFARPPLLGLLAVLHCVVLHRAGPDKHPTPAGDGPSNTPGTISSAPGTLLFRLDYTSYLRCRLSSLDRHPIPSVQGGSSTSSGLLRIEEDIRGN